MMKRFAFTFILFSTFVLANTQVCKVCRMEAGPENKAGFEIKVPEGVIPFCSLSCVKRYRKKHPKGEISVRDYTNGNFLDANKAFFVHGCDKLSDMVPNAMPPVVIAFASKEKASELLNKIHCGKIATGIEAIK